MEDTEIIDLFWQRSEQAIAELSGKYSGYCFKIAWNLLENREDVEECLNDTWFAAWSHIPPQRPSALSAFVGKITRGLAIDCFRRKHAAKRMDSHMADVWGEMDELSFSYTLDEQMAERNLMETINAFLGNLSPKDRDIFVRRYWYFDSVKEIAKRHGTTGSAIKMNLHRNRKKLLKELRKEAEEL